MNPLIRNAITQSRSPQDDIAHNVVAVSTKIQAFIHHLNVAAAQLDLDTIDAALQARDRSLLVKNGILFSSAEQSDARVSKLVDGFFREHEAFQASFTSEISHEVAESHIFDGVLAERVEAVRHNCAFALEQQRHVMEDLRKGTGPFSADTEEVLRGIRWAGVEQITEPQPGHQLSAQTMPQDAGALSCTAMMTAWSAHSIRAIADDMRPYLGDQIDMSIAPSDEELRVLVDYVQSHEAELLEELEVNGDHHRASLSSRL